MKFLSTKKPYILFGLLLVLLLVVPVITHAADNTSVLGALTNLVNPSYWIGKLLEVIVLPIAAAAMAFAGMVLDYAVRFSLGTSYIFGNINVINQSWVIIRDICNLFFIFALIWISISTILNLSGFDTKRRLTQLIIAALVINFSLYFTKVFVDVSNIFGNWLYGGIMNSLQANGANSSISALIASKFDIFRLWEPKLSAAALAESLTSLSSSSITAIFKLLVVLVATYVFMYTAILFITRAVTIIFLLVLSPIGFVGGLLPQIEEYSKKWWSELVDAVTFPIVYLLMLYISLQLINNMDKSSVWAGFFSGNPAVVMGIDVGKTFKYVIVIIALLICLEVAKESAGKLGKAASGFAGGVSKFATSIGGGSAALLGKYTVGAAAARAANSKAVNQVIAGGGITGLAAGAVKDKLSSAADFHFDPRASIKEFGVKGGKGYVSTMKQQQKDQEEAMKTLAPSKADLKATSDITSASESRVYGGNEKYGTLYNKEKEDITEANKIINDPKANSADKNEAIKKLNRAKGNLSDLKTLIEDDDKEIGSKMFMDKKEALDSTKIRLAEAKRIGDTENAQKLQSRIGSIEATMRQEKAAQSAAAGIGIGLAKAVDRFTDKMPEVAKIVAAPVNQLASAASKQYIEDTDKTVKKLRETMKGDESTKEQDKIARMLARMASTDAPAAPKPTPPADGKPAPEIYTGSERNPPRSTTKYS